MLFSDPARTVQRILFDGAGPADASVTDEYGVQHILWRIADPATIRLLATAMADKKLIIADGHHRYETALAYAKEHGHASSPRAQSHVNQLPQPPYPEAAAMMTFVNMDAEGLVILPTHRLVHGLSAFDPAAFQRALEAYFDVEKLPAGSDACACLQKLGAQAGVAFVAVMRQRACLLTARAEAIAPVMASVPERQRRLDLAQLHTVVLERILGLTAESIRAEENLRYLRDAAEAMDQVSRNAADVAFLTRPVSLEQLKEIAFAGEVMPQKSTDFYPKLLSGLAIYALE